MIIKINQLAFLWLGRDYGEIVKRSCGNTGGTSMTKFEDPNTVFTLRPVRHPPSTLSIDTDMKMSILWLETKTFDSLIDDLKF